MAVKEFTFGPSNYVEADYVESNYAGEGSAYFTFTVTPSVTYGGTMSWVPYVEEGYVEGLYVESAGSQFGLSVDASRLRGTEVNFVSTFTVAVDANVTYSASVDLDTASLVVINERRIRSVDVTLDTIVNLNIQADVIKAVTTSVDFNSAFTLDTFAITYTPQPLPNGRPHDFVIYRQDSGSQPVAEPERQPRFDTTNPYDGVASYKYDSLSNRPLIASDIEYQVQSTDDFAFESWVRLDNNAIIGDSKSFIHVGASVPSGEEVDGVSGGFSVGLYNATFTGDTLSWHAGSQSDPLRTTSQLVPEATWFHIAVTRNNGTYRLYYNNTLIDSFVMENTFSFFGDTDTNYVSLVSRGQQAHFDNASFRVGASDILGYNQTITQDEYTYVVATFENTIEDVDLGYVYSETLSYATTSALTVDANQTAGADVDFASVHTFAVDPNVDYRGTATLNSEANLTTAVERLRTFSVDFNTSASKLSIINKIGSPLIDFDSEAQISTDAVKIVAPLVNLSSTSELDVVAGNFTVTDVTFDSEFTQTVEGGRLTDSTSTFDSEFAFDITAERIKDTSVSFTSTATQTVTGRRLRASAVGLNSQTTISVAPTYVISTTIGLDTSSTFSVDPNVTKGTALSFNSVFNLTAITGAVYAVNVPLTSTSTLAVSGNLLVTNHAVWSIQGEDRTYTVPSEDRTYTIPYENRTYSIQGEM